ncbi:MAG: substrate-binding domain-containing protein [Luteolibacter sp.]
MEKRRKVIVLVFPPITDYSRRVTLGIVERHLAYRDWTIIQVPRLILGESPFATGGGGGVNPDGVIVWAEARDLWVHDLLGRGIPVVNCGKEWIGVKGVASVHFNYDDIHRTMIRHFSELGLKRVVAVGHLLEKRPNTRRTLEDFVEMARDAGMDSRLWELGGKDSPMVMPRRLLATEQESELADFLGKLRKPAAVYCYGSHIGYIVAAVASRLGIKVPAKLAIAGFGGEMVASFADPPLTTIDGSAHEIGRAAADCLADWLEHGEPPFTDLAIPGSELIERESTIGKSGSVVMAAIHRFISAHAKRGVTLGELVAMSGLSVKTLVRQYHETFGLDPMKEIHQLRVLEAKRLLDKHSLPISEVASNCGFTSQAAFANYFQRHTGYAPRQYRKASSSGEI